MAELVIRIRPRDVAAICLMAGFMGGGFAAVQAFTSTNTTNGLPLVIPYQGTFSENGTPKAGTQQLTFKLYDASTGGTKLWESNPRNLTLVGGKFSVVLGDTTLDTNEMLEPSDFAEENLFVEVVVGGSGGTPLSPRQRIAPSPQAITTIQAAGDFDVPGEVSAGTASISGAFGVGGDVTLGDSSADTTRALGELVVDGNTTLGDSAATVTTIEGDLMLKGRFLADHSTGPAPYGTYCGSTGARDGALSPGTSGYAGGQQLCQAACSNSPTAHMCTGSELALSMQVGSSPPQTSWYAGTHYSFARNTGGGLGEVNSSCRGWTTNSLIVSGVNQYGSILNVPSNSKAFFDHSGCNEMYPIACCD